MAKLRFAIIGCGYVADFYARTLPNHSNLELAGVFDRDSERLERFCGFYGLRRYASVEEAISDPEVRVIANLTNPTSHYAVSKAALDAGKHVYSEKPLAMTFSEAEELVQLAERQGVLLACAPCNILGEAAQTLWKALRDGRIGTPRLAYAEVDDDFLFREYSKWTNESGCQWPFKDEFRTGCTLEHAGYQLGCLTAFFGPATHITGSAGLCGDSGPFNSEYAPAFALGCIEFASGVVARITCSSYASTKMCLEIFGDTGILSTTNCWNYAAPVFIDQRQPRSWREIHPRRAALLGIRPRIRPVRRTTFKFSHKNALRMDYSRGISELADAVLQNREPRMSAKWSLHVAELSLALASGQGVRRELRTSFSRMHPMPWAI